MKFNAPNPDKRWDRQISPLICLSPFFPPLPHTQIDVSQNEETRQETKNKTSTKEDKYSNKKHMSRERAAAFVLQMVGGGRIRPDEKCWENKAVK